MIALMNHYSLPITALVRVETDIMMSIDQGKPVILVLLDLSSAFDTVDHNVLFSRLKDMFVLSGNELEWLNSIFGTTLTESAFSWYFI